MSRKAYLEDPDLEGTEEEEYGGNSINDPDADEPKGGPE